MAAKDRKPELTFRRWRDGTRNDAVKFRASEMGADNDALLRINPSATCEDCGYPALAHALGDTQVICPPRTVKTKKMQEREQRTPPVQTPYRDYNYDAVPAARLAAAREAQKQRYQAAAIEVLREQMNLMPGSPAYDDAARRPTRQPYRSVQRATDGLSRPKRKYDDDY